MAIRGAGLLMLAGVVDRFSGEGECLLCANIADFSPYPRTLCQEWKRHQRRNLLTYQQLARISYP